MLILLAIAYSVVQMAFLLGACIAIEQIATLERYSWRDRVPGILMQLGGTCFGFFLMYPLNLLWRHVEPAIVIPLWTWLQPLGMAGYALQFLTLIVVADFLAYWRHRAEHSRWWWPVHKVHHAPTELHAANDIGHPIQGFFSFLFITAPMSLIQIDGPATPVALGMLVTFLTYYIHSPIDAHFGSLRWLVVDNRFHRIHHSLEPRHFDKNFGICFSIWDRIFGTAYYPGKEEWPAVGVAGVRAPRTLRDYLMLPIRGSIRTSDSEQQLESASSGRRVTEGR